MGHMEHWIETIKEWMAENDWNAAQLAKAIGCGNSCVGKWLNGENSPSLEYIVLIADAMNVSLDYLLWLTEEPTFAPSRTPSSFAERLNRLLKENKISKNKLAAVCGVTSSTVSKWLLRGQLPKPRVMICLARNFGCSVDYLVGRTDAP